MPSALGGTRFVDDADCIGSLVLANHDSPTDSQDFVMIPANGFEKSLEGSGGDLLTQCDCLDVLALQVGKQAPDVGREQLLAFDAVKTTGKKSEKLGEQSSERCDILERPSVVSL